MPSRSVLQKMEDSEIRRWGRLLARRWICSRRLSSRSRAMGPADFPSYGSNAGPVALRSSLPMYLLNSAKPLARAGVEFRVSPFDQCLYFVLRGRGGAAGTVTTHIDIIRGRDELGALSHTRAFRNIVLGRRRLKKSPLDTWAWNCPSNDPSVKLAQAAFANNWTPFPTFCGLSAPRQSKDDFKLSQCK